MKKYLLLFIFVSIVFTAFGQEGTIFEDISYGEALAKAKNENRLVFIDCYTQWCGPCKRMASNVFPLKEVGDYMNGHFVNLKVDMEKGEGVALRKEFRVESFPTFLIIHPDGTLYHKFNGAVGPKTFIAKLEEALQGDRTFGVLEKSYREGNRYQVYIQIAKALHGDDIHKFLTACEREFVKIPYKNVPKKVYTLYGDRMTDAQKARRDDLMKELEARK